MPTAHLLFQILINAQSAFSLRQKNEKNRRLTIFFVDLKKKLGDTFLKL